MRELIFIDTKFVIALIYQNDKHHQKAINLSAKYKQYSFVTTDAVLLELGNVFVHHSKPKAIKIIEDFYSSDNVDIVNVTPQLFEEAFNLYKQYNYKNFGLIDGISLYITKKIIRKFNVNEKTINLDRQYYNNSWSLVDCVSLIVMQKLQINNILTFNENFSQAGFKILTE